MYTSSTFADACFLVFFLLIAGIYFTPFFFVGVSILQTTRFLIQTHIVISLIGNSRRHYTITAGSVVLNFIIIIIIIIIIVIIILLFCICVCFPLGNISMIITHSYSRKASGQALVGGCVPLPHPHPWM